MTTPYYQDDSVTLYHGDALALLAELPDQCVDAVVTDPPYSSGGAFRSDRSRKTSEKYLSGNDPQRLPDFYGDNRTERGLLLWSSLWLAEAWRATRDGGAIAIFCDWRSLPTFSDALQSGGWSWRGIGVWSKPQHTSRPTIGGLWNDTEYILWGSRGARTKGEALPGVWHAAAPPSQERRHATEKPLAIVGDLVRLAPPGGLVLDPFAGSCTTGVAAAEQGRVATLVEQSAQCARVGRDRLSARHRTGADTHQIPASGTASLFEATA